MKTYLTMALVLLAVLCSFTGSSSAQCQKQPCQRITTGFLSNWKAYDKRPGDFYRPVHIAKGRAVELHFYVWRKGDPNNCYCYNNVTKKYWARWFSSPKVVEHWQFIRLPEEPRASDIPPPPPPPGVPTPTDLPLQ